MTDQESLKYFREKEKQLLLKALNCGLLMDLSGCHGDDIGSLKARVNFMESQLNNIVENTVSYKRNHHE